MEAKRTDDIDGYHKLCVACDQKLRSIDRYCRMCGRRQPDTITETDEVNVYKNPSEAGIRKLFIKGEKSGITLQSTSEEATVENGKCGAVDRGYGIRFTGDGTEALVSFDSLQEAEIFACWMLKQVADQREAHDLHHSEGRVETTADLHNG